MAAGSSDPQSQTRGRDSTPSPIAIELDRLHTHSPDVTDPDEGRHITPESHSSLRHDSLLVGPDVSRRSMMETHVDSELERRVRRKLDFILLPFLSLLFLFNSLDKSNIGSAETGHFTKDTGLPASALNVSVACFFAAFVTLQPVGAALGRKFGMARYVPTCMALWGICTAGHIFIKSEWQLVVLRTTVGVLEAGFYPTTVSYLSLFYTRFEFAKRLGMFYGQAAVAGAFGGLLSWAVFKQFPDTPGPSSPPGPHLNSMGSHSSWKSWQVLFVIEGLVTTVIALIGFVWLPHSADTAWFLSSEERICAEARIRKDQEEASLQSKDDDHKTHSNDRYYSTGSPRRASAEAEAAERPSSSDEIERLLPARPDLSKMRGRSFRSTHSVTNDRGLDRSDIVAAITDWKVWYLLACNILSAIPATAFSVFLPLVVKGLAHASTSQGTDEDMAPATANLLTVPPFIAGAVVLWIFTAWSDRRRERLIPVLCGLVILLVGLIATVLLPADAYLPRYIALIVLLSGSFVPSPLTVAWLTNNMLEPGKRAIVLGINGWGNLAGVLAAMLFAPKYRDSGYVLPFFVTLACVGVSFVGFVGFRLMIMAINAKRARIVAAWDFEEREREAVSGDVGGLRGTRWPSWVGWSLDDGRKARVGEEKLTFQYGL